MLKPETVTGIIEMYTKYGWKLRRVLLTDQLGDNLAAIFDRELIHSSDIDALWFSRPARNGGETWELRRLSETPYALLEVFEPDEDETVKEETLIEIQDKMKLAAVKN